jgi:hypothetical protein
LKHSDESEAEDESGKESAVFKARPFPKNLFCNFAHYKMWEDNYFR